KSSTGCGSATAQAAGPFSATSFHVDGTAIRHPVPVRSTKPAGSGGGANVVTRACFDRLQPAAVGTARKARQRTARRDMAGARILQFTGGEGGLGYNRPGGTR